MRNRRPLVLPLPLVVALLAWPILAYAGDSSQTDSVAAKLVNQSAQVKEGEHVLITGSVRDVDLLESISLHVRKAGAHPFVSLVSPKAERRSYDIVPAKYDSQAPSFDLKLANFLDVIISVDALDDPKLFADVPAQRMQARAAAYQPVTDMAFKRGIRQVNLGNAVYPTEFLAQRHDISREQLADIFWKGVNVDESMLRARADWIKKSLAGTRQIHITSPSGTDLKVNVAGRPVLFSTGVITPQDPQRKAASSMVWLPAGEVYLTPVPATAEGKVVVDRFFWTGEEITGLTLSFRGGKLTGISSKSGNHGKFKEAYDAAPAGKEQFAFVDFGINSDFSAPGGKPLLSFIPAGNVTVGLGENRWAGGDNAATFAASFNLTGTTVRLDGTSIVESGRLLSEGEAAGARR